MNPTFFISCTILLLCVGVYAEYEALIFDRVKHMIFNLPDNVCQEDSCGALAAACPMQELSESPDKEFLKNCSITGNALVVRDIYRRDSPTNKVTKYICQQPFRISLVFNIMKRVYELGYEIFFDAEKDHLFESSEYKNYVTLKEAVQMLTSPYSQGKFYGREFISRIPEIFTDSPRTKWYNDDKKMKFIWIALFKMRYSSSKMMVKNVTYEIRQSTGGPLAPKCEESDYTLGSEAYAGIEDTVDSLYANQMKIFEELKTLSALSSCEGESCILIQPCETNNDCLEKWPLIPMNQFHLFRTSPMLCSNMFTIPIWKDAVKGALEKLDQYLYALFRYLGDQRLHVISGVSSSTLTLPYKKINVKGLKGSVYLDPKNKKMPVPEFIYKIVKYQPKLCDLKEKNCEFAVIFIINNNPNFKPSDKICSENEDFITDWGWGAVTKDSNGQIYENIYACPNKKSVLKTIYGVTSIAKPSPMSKNLKLTQFPVYDEIKETINEDNDIVVKVDEMFEELATKGEDLEFNDIIAWNQENNEYGEDIDEDTETIQ